MSGTVRLVISIVLAFLGGLAVCCWMEKKAPPPDPSILAGRSQAVNLKYIGSWAPDPSSCRSERTSCVELLETEIWRKRPNDENINRPNKVMWVVDNSHKRQNLSWLIKYKAGLGDDYLESIDLIKCGKRTTGAIGIKGDAVFPSGKAEWQYKVAVYKCDEFGNVVGCLCETDPIVGIHP